MDFAWPVLRWWLVAGAIGWASVPIAARLLATLPDRGLSLARPLGFVLTGYLFWLGGTLGVLPNGPAGAWAAVAVVAGIGIWIARRDRDELLPFLRRRRRLVFGLEALFLAALLVWAAYRAYVPAVETAGGEKYMELAFINAVVESPGLPPLDPWLSGYAISYYYFGYLVAGMLVHLTGIATPIAFNLMTPLTLAMTLAGAFGLGYGLVARSPAATRGARVLGGAFTASLLALLGSLAGLVELGFLRGWGTPGLYRFLDIRDLVPGAEGACGEAPGAFGAGAGGTAATGLQAWVPQRFIWWWRGSRIIHDDCAEVIHEFPFFSFMLGDVHPHVTALPYVLLVLGLAFAVLSGLSERLAGRRLWSPSWLALPLVVGSLGFLNTWDLPTFGFVVVAAYALRASWRLPRSPAASPEPGGREPSGAPVPVPGPADGDADVPAQATGSGVTAADGAATRPGTPDAGDRAVAVLGVAALAAGGWKLAPGMLAVVRGVPVEAQPAVSRMALALAIVVAGAGVGYSAWSRASTGDRRAAWLVDVGRFAVWLATLSIVLYLPFYIGLGSQAEGVGFVAVRSRLAQWLVHFGLPWFLAASVAAAWLRSARPGPTARALALVPAAVALASVIAGAVTAAVVAMTLALALLALGARLESRSAGDRSAVDDAPAADEATAAVELDAAPMFALLCVSVGLLLPLATEFVFLRDQFGSRMNTIFKLYYQAWVLLAVGGGYALWSVRSRWGRTPALAWRAVVATLVLASALYPAMAIHTRTGGFGVERLTLDGLDWWVLQHPGDLAGARWLRENTPKGTVIVEAPGGAYEHEGRLSMASGRPTLLGWEGHEHQWRGREADMVAPRKADVEAIYRATSRDQLDRLLERYQARYVAIGDSERSKYQLTAGDVERLRQLLPEAWRSPDGQLVILERR